jgi:hypothetical protein
VTTIPAPRLDATCQRPDVDPDWWSLPTQFDAATLPHVFLNLVALTLCRRECLALDWCKAQPFNEGMVQAGRTTKRPPAECGTEPGWQRHRRGGENPCDDCWKARRVFQRDDRLRRLARRAATL